MKIELVLLPAFVTAFYLFIDASWTAIALFTGAYLFSSLLLSPDLDLRHNETRRRWGLLGFIWIPYTKIFKHRGLSHSLFLGTLTRLAYLGLLAFIVACGLSSLNLRVAAPLPSTRLYLWFVGLIGLWLPNMLHALVDRSVRRWRRRR